MNLWITGTLVLFQLYLTLGHSLAKIELLNATDTYELRENDGTSVRVVNPKPEKPTLREIIYYHLIERPYDDVNQINKNSDTEDMDSVSDETQRSFTNSHGFQFLDSPTEDEQNFDNTKGPGDDVEVVYYDEISEEVSTEPEFTSFAPKSDEGNVILRKEVTTTEEYVNAETTTTVEETTTVPETTTYDDVEIEKINTRNRLFDQLRQKYEHQRRGSDITTRNKREANMGEIPEAPTLPELNYDSLPDFVREILSTTPKPQSSNIEKHEDEEIKKALENKLAEILANLSPQRDEDSEENATTDETDETARRVPRTYGMNLTMDGGYVWNALNDPPVVFEVGIDEVGIDEEKSEETEDTKDESEENHSESINVDNHDNNASEDIFVNIHKDKTTQSSVAHKKSKSEEILSSLRLESEEEITKSEEELTTNNEEKETDDQHDGEVKPDDDDDNSGQVRKIDILVEVLKDERFWKWLAQWTRTYMDLLTKYIRKIAKEEIEKHLIEHPESISGKSIEKSVKPIEVDTKILEPSSDFKDSIVINERKVPVTHISNINKIDDVSAFLKSKKKNTDHKNKHIYEPNSTKNKTKEKSPIATEAQNIYGYVSNSDRVTNIFIFNSNNDTNKLIEELTPNSIHITNTTETVDTDITTESSPIEINTTETPGKDNRTVVNNSSEKVTAENGSMKADTSELNVSTTRPLNLDKSSSETTETPKTKEDKDKNPSTDKSKEKVDDKEAEEHENEDKIFDETPILNKDPILNKKSTETEPESATFPKKTETEEKNDKEVVDLVTEEIEEKTDNKKETDLAKEEANEFTESPIKVQSTAKLREMGLENKESTTDISTHYSSIKSE